MVRHPKGNGKVPLTLSHVNFDHVSLMIWCKTHLSCIAMYFQEIESLYQNYVAHRLTRYFGYFLGYFLGSIQTFLPAAA